MGWATSHSVCCLYCYLRPSCWAPCLHHPKPICLLPNPSASLALPTPTYPGFPQTSSPSSISPLPTMSLLLSCFEPQLLSSLPAPPDLSVASLSQLSSLPHLTHTRGGSALRMKSLRCRVLGRGQPRVPRAHTILRVLHLPDAAIRRGAFVVILRQG